MEATQKNNRDLAVDLIKTFAIVGVLLIHTAASAYSTNALGSPSWYFALFWGSVSRASVPLFLMCSGVLFLSPQRELPGTVHPAHFSCPVLLGCTIQALPSHPGEEPLLWHAAFFLQGTVGVPT